MRGGFTLIEVLIVIFISLLIMAGTIFNTSDFRLNSAVQAAVNEIVRITAEARNLTSTGKELTNGLFPNYGVMFDISNPRAVVLFADCNLDDAPPFGVVDDKDDFTFQASGTSCDGGNGLVQSVNFTNDSRVGIRAVRSIEETTQTGSRAHIVFIRPEPSTWVIGVNNSAQSYGRVEVDVGDAAGTYLKTIRFWTSGHVEIK